MSNCTNQYEFQYHLRDENGTIDEGVLLTEVVKDSLLMKDVLRP